MILREAAGVPRDDDVIAGSERRRGQASFGELLRRSTPRQVPATLARTCAALEPQLTGAVPLPTVAQVISALEAGQPPPLPLLALPTVRGGRR